MPVSNMTGIFFQHCFESLINKLSIKKTKKDTSLLALAQVIN